MSRVTINMIAERAGVSRGTVDRVLHNRPEVAPDVRERVILIAKLLGYIDRTDSEKLKTKHIGIIMPGNNWFDSNLKNELRRGIDDAVRIVAPLGYHVEICECETDLPDEILDELQRFRKNSVDGIIMTSRVNEQIVQCINELAEEQIPVITYNSDIPGCKKQCFVGQNLYKSGRVAANLMKYHLRHSGRVLVVAGNLEFEAHRQRVKGFLDKCTESGIDRKRIEVVESYNEHYRTNEYVKKALQKYEDLRAIYMANESIVACVEAVEECGKRDGLLIVGNDLTKVSGKLLEKDAIDFILTQNIYWQGFRPVMIMKKAIEMPEIPIKEDYFTNIGIMTSDAVRAHGRYNESSHEEKY